jgi:beta-galactosidase
MNRIALLVGVVALALGRPDIAAAQRQRLSMDPGWRFVLGDVTGAERAEFDDRQWRLLDLPHDWSIEGTPDRNAPGGGRVGYFPTGVGWYRKAFRVPAGPRGRLVSLEFDGVYMNADVWINGVHLGRRPYGYTSFAYDVTPHLRAGINVVAVRVDNSAQPNSRWYSGSGIYRHTWLTSTDPLHVGRWGTVITTPRADSAGAEALVRTRVENAQPTIRRGTLRSIVLDASGREVARTESPFSVEALQDVELDQRLQVATPRLWSPETPALYTLRQEVLDGARTADVATVTFGIRTIAYDADRGFLLNGRRIRMDGVNLHHDGGAVGAAVPERVWERRLAILKAMGTNAIRTSHNPPAPEFLDLCDRMGFLVMAEAFDEWTLGKVEQGYHRYFAAWSERDLADFVRRDRHHPSIVLWSAGNEIGEQDTPEGVGVLRRLMDIIRREDPTRPITTGNDHIAADGGRATVEFLNTLDIVGYNYVDRWHDRRELMAEQDRHDHPAWRMIGTESVPAVSTFGGTAYSLGTDTTALRPNYTTGMLRAERLWKWVSTHEYFAGDFMWTGIDYLGESFWPSVGFAAAPVDITGHPRSTFYFYQSQWARRPVLHLFPHWNWPGRRGQTIPVLAYSNCSLVELFLNGRPLGAKALEFPAQGTSGGWNSYALPQVPVTTNDLHLAWDVPYEPGELRAVGRHRDGSACAEDVVRTAGSPAAIRLAVDRDTVTDGPGDVAHVTWTIVDSAGTVVPTAEHEVRILVTGGSLVALDNGNLRDHTPYRADRRRAFNGRGLAIVRAAQPGRLTVTASVDGMPTASVSVTVVRGAAVGAVPAAR